MRVPRVVAVAVVDVHLDAEAAVPARARDGAGGGRVHRRAVVRFEVERPCGTPATGSCASRTTPRCRR